MNQQLKIAVITPLVAAAAVGMMGAKMSCGAGAGERPTITQFEGYRAALPTLPPGYGWDLKGHVQYGNRKGLPIWKPVKLPSS